MFTGRLVITLALLRPDKRSTAQQATLRQAKAVNPPEVCHALAVLEDFASPVHGRPMEDSTARLDAWEAHAEALGARELAPSSHG